MGALRLLITGASGFLGRACVEAAIARGHDVCALVRRPVEMPRGIRTLTADLAEGVPVGALEEVDCVIHIAAALSNDWTLLERDTLRATQSLAEAMALMQAPPRIILASSISVYAADAPEETIDETSPVEASPSLRENYVQAKIAQEVACAAAGLHGFSMRIGAIYSAERLWNAHIGLRKGPLLVSLGRKGNVPLVHVADAAEALVLAAEAAGDEAFEPLNIVESDLPSRAAVIERLRMALHLPLNWRMLMPFGYLAEAALGARAPGLLRPKVIKARMAPHLYSNAAAKARLGWTPQHRFAEAQA